jgi:chemosensory pili system protein ChpA (sensor histidine kinase/response regulator)
MGAEQAERAQRGRKHVFAVNGSSDFLNVVRELLEEERYNVTTTNFVPATFDQIAAARPDLVVVDLAFGREAGWDLLERLEADALTRGVPVLVVSTDPRLLERAATQQARYGADRYLAKPLDLDALLDGVAALVGPA